MKTAHLQQPLAEYGGPLSATLIFALPGLALTSKYSFGVVQLLIVLVFARHFLAIAPAYRQHWRAIRWTVLAFTGYFLVSLLRMLIEQQGLHTLDGPSRLFIGLICIGVFYYLRPAPVYFWLGLCFSAILAALVAIYQITFVGLDRAIGFTHHEITFGDLALATGLLALCGLSALRHTRLSALPGIALLCGMIASLSSASRGGWLALPLVLLPLLRYGTMLYGRRLLAACALLAALLCLALMLPMTGIAHRIGDAVNEVQRYLTLGDANTSVGIRLELWKASLMMLAEHPWLGVGRDAFDGALQTLVAQGRLQPSAALSFSSSHNDVLNSLATGGLLDFSLLLLMYAAPLHFFSRQLGQPDRGQRELALAGLVLVVAFIGFGITDVMFWLMLPKVFYVMLVCSLIGMCLAAQHPLPAPRRILITRTDNIGDVVLTLPLAAYLKQRFPQAEIVFLCRRYAAAVVAQCRYVDRLLILEDMNNPVQALADSGCDTVIFAYPQRRLARAAQRAGIARRIGSSHRWYHWFSCNRLANFSRVASPLHEAQLNFKLLLALGIDEVPALAQVWPLYGLRRPQHASADALLAGPGFKLILHPKSNGNGREWPLAHYSALAALLGAHADIRVLITGSASEGALLAQQAPELLALPRVENLCGQLDLTGFVALIGGCDALVASGTGPLHIAAAMGRPVLGLFPPIKPIDVARWGALGQQARNLCAAHACEECNDPAQCRCMQAITPQQVYEVVLAWHSAALLDAAIPAIPA